MSYILGDAKPPLDEALLEHYGVKGMRWGVRRDQATLDRAAGRKTARAERKANKPKSRSQQIKEARKDVLPKRRQEFKDASGFKAKADIFLKGEFSKHLSEEYKANPNRRIAFQQTTGEQVATSLLAIPSLGTSVVVSLGNKSMVKAIQNNQEIAALKQTVRKKNTEVAAQKLLELEKKGGDPLDNLVKALDYADEKK